LFLINLGETMRRFCPHSVFASALASLSSLAAQGYSTDFETFMATSAGTACAGQDGFYVPAVAGSIDGAIYTYTGNPLGLAANPFGGVNFWGGVSQGGTAFARSQRALTLPSGLIHVEFDVACNFVGTLTPTQNIGSISFQPSATNAHVNLLARWTSLVLPPTSWSADYVLGPSPTAGVQTTFPDPAFNNLALGVWYRWGVTVDLVAGVYVDFSIRDATTFLTTYYVPPTPWALPGQGLGAGATDFRLFAGGTNAGNVFAVDNVVITYGSNYTTFGTGCPGGLGIPTLAAATGSKPILGTVLQVNLGNLPFGVGLMITGLSNTLLGGAIPLPFPLAGLGFPGCDLLVDPLFMDTVIGPGTSGTWNFPIPYNPALAGFTFYNQGASLEAGPALLAFSNGGTAVLGF
jgi:hypothetical protein